MADALADKALAALRRARTAGEIVSALQAGANLGRPGDPPELTPEELGEWLADAPGAAVPGDRPLFSAPSAPGWRGGKELAALYDWAAPEASGWRGGRELGGEWADRYGGMAALLHSGLATRSLSGFSGEIKSVEDVHGTWLAWRDERWESGKKPVHPLTPIVRAWIERPPKVRANRRLDPLLPVVRTVREAPEREAGRLAFGGIVEGRKSKPAQLPLLPASEGPRVPLLDLVDERDGPIMVQGRGAPLDLRLFVGACIMTPATARASRCRLVTTVRELRDFLYPNGWQRGRDWPRIREALLKAQDYMIPGRFDWHGHTVDGWLPFGLVGGIGEGAGLDDSVLIDVDLPPGAASGPPIDRAGLAALGVDSAPRFRAYIAAHSVSWIPGRTQRPHPRDRSLWLWSSDPAHYPVLTAEDRRRLAFGEGDKRNRTRANLDGAWERLPGAVILTREAMTPDGRAGWRIVPEAAAEVIRSRDEGDLPNPRR